MHVLMLLKLPNALMQDTGIFHAPTTDSLQCQKRKALPTSLIAPPDAPHKLQITRSCVYSQGAPLPQEHLESMNIEDHGHFEPSIRRASPSTAAQVSGQTGS